MKKIKFFLFIFLFSLCFASCSSTGSTNSKGNTSDKLDPDTNFEKNEEEMFTDRDNDSSYDDSNVVNISLNKDSITCNSDKVKIEGSTITIVDEATFIISGTLNDGKIVVNADDADKPQLVFNNVSITNTSFAPLYIVDADKVFITLQENSVNELINDGTLTSDGDNNVDGAVFSKQDLTFNGSGTINITSSGHGIVCKDDLVFTSGTYNINASSHGLDVNDSIRINDSDITINAGKDGMHCENSDDDTLGYIYIADGILNINSGDDGISSNYSLQIDNGIYNIKTTSSYTTENTSLKGIKATSSILINDGKFIIDSYDDSIHSNLSIIINGGNFELSSNDDGIHADETLQIINGIINILKSYEGLEALTINILGGDISLVASDDGINAAGGNDSSGFDNPNLNGGFGGGRPGGRPGDNFGGESASGNGYIEISGGNIYIQSSGDGIDANGDLLISGGITYVCGPTSGDTAVLDYDKTGKITGGEFYGSGAYMMAQSLTGDGQGVIGVKVGNISANTTITVTDSSNNIVAEYTPKLSYQIVIISNDKIIKGNTYTISIGFSSSNVKAQ